MALTNAQAHEIAAHMITLRNLRAQLGTAERNAARLQARELRAQISAAEAAVERLIEHEPQP